MRSLARLLLLLAPAALACSPAGVSSSARTRAQGAAVPVLATYDPALGAPACRQTSSACHADQGILVGRGPLGPETGAPNTLGGSCADGTDGTFGVDPTLDGLAVGTPDGTELTAGGQALVTAFFFAGASYQTEALDLFIAADARSPQWIHVNTVRPPAGAAGPHVVQVPITLLGGDLQAVRGVYRSGDSAVPTLCPGGPLDDVDDLAFAVAGGVPPPPPPPPLEAAVYDPSLMAPACTGAGYGCSSGDLLRLDPMIPFELNAPNTLGMSCLDPFGPKDTWSPLIDAISVVTLEGPRLAAGKRVRVTADASRLAAGSFVSLFHASNTRGSAWTQLGSLVASGATERLEVELTLPNGRHQAVRAVTGAPFPEMSCGGTDQDDLAFAVDSPLGLASWDPLLGVPACPDASPSCESGSLLTGRGTGLDVPEPNSPNTLEGCPDGPYPTFAGQPSSSTPSIEALRVSSHDGLPLTALHPVRVEATVRAEQGSVVEFYVNDGWMGSWRSLGRAQPEPGEQVIAFSFAPLIAGTIAVRASIDLGHWSPSPDFCSSTTGYRDTDDLAFPVAPPDGTPSYRHPSVSLTAPADGSVMTSLPLRLAAEATADPLVQRIEFWLNGELVGTRFEPPFELAWTPGFPPAAGERLEVQARVYDGFGGSADSLPVRITAGDLYPPEVAFAAHEPVVHRWWTTVELVAADQGSEPGVARIDLLSDGAPVGTLASPPWSFSWDLSAAADGPHTLTAVAYDWAGNSAQAALTLTVDGTPPTGGIVIPAPGAHVRGIVPVTIVADDVHGPVWAPVWIEGRAGGTAFVDRPFLWNTALETDGPHELWTYIVDGVGNPLYLPPIPVVVDNSLPTASFVSPGPGAVVGGPVEVAVSAEDPWGLAVVEVTAGGQAVLSAVAPPYSTLWDPGTLAEGPHTLTLRAVDLAGNVASASQVVLVDRLPPSVNLLAPAAPGAVRGIVPLRAAASDANGIALVEFWAQDPAGTGTLVAVATPDGDGFAASWDTAQVPSGRYVLHARAVDGAGREATSPGTEVVVDNTAPAVSITSPSSGAAVAGTVRVVTLQSDAPLPVTGIQLVIDGDRSAAWLDATAALDWDTTAVPNGPHTIQVRARDAAGNEGESPATAVQVLNPPPPGTQLLHDTSFEAGQGSPWVVSAPSVFQTGSSPPAHGGMVKAALGGHGTASTDLVRQPFLVPATATTLTVKLWLQVHTAETAGSARDRLRVRLYGPTGSLLATLATYSNVNAASTGWVQKTLRVAVSGQRGKALTLAFEATEDKARQTTFFVDDVTATWRN